MRRDRDGLDPAFVVAVVILVAVAVFLYLTASSAPEASADNGAEIGTALRAHVDPSECRYVRSDGRHGYTDREIRRTIRCAVRRWPVPGGPSFAIAVARCESGFEAEAYNAGGYGGVYQQSIRYWPERFRRWNVDRWDLPDRVFSGRANVTISIRQAHVAGWSAWACP